MIINNQQIITTLDILCARHKKIINESQNKITFKEQSLNELEQAVASLNAIKLYNNFKQNYQPSIKK